MPTANIFIRTTRKPQLKVGLINARSVCNKMNSLNDLIVDSKIDILGLSETWLNGDDHDVVTVGNKTSPGYSLQDSPCHTCAMYYW